MNTFESIIHEPAADYHAKSQRGEYLSSHMLADFRKCPALYHRKLNGEIQEVESTAFTLGRAAHTLILEGRGAFDDAYFIGEPINPKTGDPFGKNTKAYAEWAAGQTKEVIAPKDFEFLMKLQAAVWMHPAASDLLIAGEAEGVVRAEYCGMKCQIRMDWFNPERGIIDLKTCDDLTWFEADSRRFGYIAQLAFYRAVLRMRLGCNVPVHIIAVEKREPFRAGVWRVSAEALDCAEQENAAAIARLIACRQNGVWPTGYEEIRCLDNL